MTPRTLISAFLVFTLAGCDGTLGGGDWDEGNWGEAAEEPEDGSEYAMQVTGLPAGTTVKVCKTNGASLNVRSGAGSGYKLVAQLEEGDETTILASSGSWYKHEGGGWSYHAYLCAEGTPPEPKPEPNDPPPDPGAGVCGSFQHPVPGAPVTSNFGPRWGRMHNGIDLGISTGTSVRAAMGGSSTSRAGPAATVTSSTSSTAGSTRRATRTSPRSWRRRARRSPPARSSRRAAAPATAPARTSTSRSASAARGARPSIPGTTSHSDRRRGEAARGAQEGVD